MKLASNGAAVAVLATIFSGMLTSVVDAQRPMERLGRGVVAVRSSSKDVLVKWRLLGLDSSNIGFNVYRATSNSEPKRLNANVLTGGTNYVDSTADLTKENHYHVRPVLNGKEQDPSGLFSLPANNAVEPILRIPVRENGPIKFVWVGDLDGDGEFDYVVDRINTQQSIEAYTSNGTFLWEVKLGKNSENQDNIEPGSATISVGHWDGVTVFDFDSDGRAEVAIRVANGVRFGDGKTYSHSNDNEQFIAILDGRTGALRGTAPLPTDYISDGPLAARFGVGYLDGKTPHLVGWFKNRKDNKDFNRMMGAWTFDGKTVTRKWVLKNSNLKGADGHNTRIIDVNEDGKDEVFEIGFGVNGDGSFRYQMPDVVVHGDRFHIAKMDPTKKGLQGYGIQQDNPSKLNEYYYDASTGKFFWEHYGTEVGDVARGMAGDIDPTKPGYEVWSFSGVYNAPSNKLAEPDTSKAPWPHLGIWWDGDELLELYNDGKFEKWDWTKPSVSSSLPRILKIDTYGGQGAGRYPMFIGDIMGDWREEVIVSNAKYNQLLVFTTDKPSDIRLYTLAHNPAYRNAMTLKGYLQSHHVDYFMGHDMATPPTPNIKYVGS